MFFPGLGTLVLEGVCWRPTYDFPLHIPSQMVQDLAKTLDMRGGLQQLVIHKAKRFTPLDARVLETAGIIGSVEWDENFDMWSY